MYIEEHEFIQICKPLNIFMAAALIACISVVSGNILALVQQIAAMYMYVNMYTEYLRSATN